MKPFLLPLVLAFFFSTIIINASDNLLPDSPSSKGVTAGGFLLEVGLGGGYVTKNAAATDIRKGFLSANASVMKALGNYLYMGLEGVLEHGDMAGNPASYGPIYGGDLATVKVDENYYNSWAVLLAFRVNLNPSSSTRVYLPYAIGYMHREQTTKYEVRTNTSLLPPGFDDFDYDFEEKKKYGEGLAGYIGIGIEHEFAQRFVFGPELRYMAFRCGGQTVGNLSILMKAGWQF